MKFWSHLLAMAAGAGLAAAGLCAARLLQHTPTRRGRGVRFEYAETLGEFPDLPDGPDERLSAEEAALRYGAAATAPRKRVLYDQDTDLFRDGAASEGGGTGGAAGVWAAGGVASNPVEAGPAQAPRTPDGKLDATRIACAEDFQGWDEFGCCN